MESINKWIVDGCDYLQGVFLYQNYPRFNPNLLRMFLRGENAQNKEKLKYELGKLKSTDVQYIAQKPERVVASVPVTLLDTIALQIETQEKKQSVFFHQLPVELQPELLAANGFWKENCLLKVQLNDLPADAESEALRIQKQIATNWKSNSACWSKIDYFLEHKRMPIIEPSSFDGLTPAQLVKRQQYLYQNISKKKKAIVSNRELLARAVLVKDKTRLERLLAKQEDFMIKYESELRTITMMIDGK